MRASLTSSDPLGGKAPEKGMFEIDQTEQGAAADRAAITVFRAITLSGAAAELGRYAAPHRVASISLEKKESRICRLQ
jgi:hypothetical protein